MKPQTKCKLKLLSSQLIKTSRGNIRLGNSPIAVGGYGIVFSGEYNGIDVAIKFFNHRDRRVDLRFAQEIFQNEISIQSSLNSAYSVQVIFADRIKIGNSHFHLYIMEQAVRNLKEYLKQSKVNGQNRISIAFELMKAVRDIHSNGVAHCDLKPENILLFRENRIAIGDFGIAFIFNGMIKGFSKPLTIHSSRYFAPEQLYKAFDSIGEKTDLFLLGMIIFELFNGYRATPGESIKRSDWIHNDKMFLDLCLNLTTKDPNSRHIPIDFVKYLE